MCFEAAASDIAKGSASWPTVRSPEVSSTSMRRRVGSLSAWKTGVSSGASNSTMWLNIDSSFLNVNHLVELFKLASLTRFYCVVSARRPDAPPRERHVPTDVDLLGPRGRLEAGPCDESGNVEPARRGEALERLAQHLALLSERRLRGGASFDRGRCAQSHGPARARALDPGNATHRLREFGFAGV